MEVKLVVCVCTRSPVQNKVPLCDKPEFKDYIKIIMHGAGLPMLSVSLMFLYF